MLLKIKQIINNKIITTGVKELYSSDIENTTKWVGLEIRGKKTYDAPQMSSAINVKRKGWGKIINNSLGYLHNNGNSVYFNGTLVSLFSSTFGGSNACGVSIIPENFFKVVALFCARKSIKGNWINDKDEYLTPCYK